MRDGPKIFGCGGSPQIGPEALLAVSATVVKGHDLDVDVIQSNVGARRIPIFFAPDKGAGERALALPPASVRAYREVYGRDPRGWPPA